MKWNRFLKSAKIERMELHKQWSRWKIGRDTFEGQDRHNLRKLRYQRDHNHQAMKAAHRAWGIYFLLGMVLMVVGVIACIDLPVPIRISNLVVESMAMWSRSPQDTQTLERYQNAMRQPWEDPTPYQVLPDVEMGC